MIAVALKRSLLALAVAAFSGLAASSAEGQTSRATANSHSSLPPGLEADSASDPRLEPLSYTVHFVELDTTGHYGWSGPVAGWLRGEASVWLLFQAGRPAAAGEWGEAPVRGRWTIDAADKAQSFDASVGGTINMLSGKGILAGAIVSGRGRGQFIEIETQFLEFGPNGALSGLTGTLRIAPALATRASRSGSAMPPQ